MKVFLTGATGFVGGHLLSALLQRGHDVTCLVRRAGRLKPPVREVLGDATRPEGLAQAMTGMDAVIHLVGIIREFPGRGVTFQRLHVEATRNVIGAARQAGVIRYLHMSSNGTRTAATPYHRTKWEAEELVRSSGLRYTIFRPSVIFGPGDSFLTLLAEIVRRAPLVPVVGSGRYLLQPVWVETVAAAFALALEREDTVSQTYTLCGPDRLTYDRILDLVGEAVGRPHPAKLHLPVPLMRALAAALGGFSWFPLTPDQITMLLEGNTCDHQPPYQLFGLSPVHLAASLGYLQG